MQVFWEVVIEPLIARLDPKVIVEIGSDLGANTRLLLAAAAGHGRVLHSIDPAPGFDVEALQEQYGECFVPHLGLSLDVLPSIVSPLDLVLIDGDHNWYTVFNELCLIERLAAERSDDFPLVLLHDVGWPYARRDLYYSPDTIPEIYRKPYAMAGMEQGRSELLERGGLNPHLQQATHEHGEKNGVLTAVEDYLATTELELQFINLPVWHGLGILYHRRHIEGRPELADFLSQLVVPTALRTVMERSESKTLELMVELRARNVDSRSEELGRVNTDLRERLSNLSRQVLVASDSLASTERRMVTQTETHELYRQDVEAQLAVATRTPAEKRRRKVRKLRADPVGFLKDAAVVRQLGIGNSAIAEPGAIAGVAGASVRGKPATNALSRKLRKLQRDPVQFFKDTVVVRSFEVRTYDSYRKHTDVRTGGVARPGMASNNQQLRKMRKLMRDPVRFLMDSRLARPLTRTPRRLRAEIELIAKSGFFDAEYYRAQSVDSSRGEMQPIEHYLLFGAAAGLKPHPDFDSTFYLLSNPDVRRVGVNPLVHYLRSGQAEGRRATPTGAHTPAQALAEDELIRASGLFDEDYYLTENPELARAGHDPVQDFSERGWLDRCNPSADFDVDFYLTSNSDVRRAGVNPLYHYLRIGAAQGREPKHMDAAAEALIVGEALDWTRNSEKRFSIVMPTWNRRDSIAKAIDSVLAQSYTRYQLIISDDGSTDGTVQYLERKYAQEVGSGRLVLLENPHKGVSAARNAGLSVATGDWIAYLDSDNTWREHYLLLMGYALHSNADRRAAYAQLSVHDLVNERDFLRRRHFDRSALRASNYIDLNVYVHDRRLYEAHGGFDESLKRLVDWDLILRQLDQEDPVYVHHVLCDYYLSGALNNITNAIPLEANLSAVRRKLESAEASRVTGCEGRRLTYLTSNGSGGLAGSVESEIRELRDLNYEVEVLPAGDHAALQHSLEENDSQWCHAHLVPIRTLGALQTSRVRGYSFRPLASDIYAESGSALAMRKLARDRRCLAVTVDNRLQADVLASRGVPRHKILCSPSSFDWLDPGQREQTRELATPLRVLAIASLLPDSGLVNLVEACGELGDTVTVRIAGDGPLGDQLRSLIAELGLVNVELVPGPETPEQRRALLRGTDVFVFPYAPSATGEHDGMPRVLLEAVNQGVPVVMTRTAATHGALADGVSAFIAPVADSSGLAALLGDVASLPASALSRLAENARQELQGQIGSRLSAHAISSAFSLSLDIVLVATDDIAWPHFNALVEDLRVLTSTPFSLKLVDNGCSESKSAQIQRMASGFPNVEVLRHDSTVGLGVASNQAFEECAADYILYICANEGAVVGHGWERPILNYMVSNPDVPLGGTLVTSPAWTTGREYTRQEWFRSFRAQSWAAAEPDRRFAHVQGGLYILRRQAFVEHGGFAVDHNYMDVEYSYYLESKGLRLGAIPAILSLSSKTRPTLRAHLDERVRAAHPVLSGSERRLLLEFGDGSHRASGDARSSTYCNIRGELTPRGESLDRVAGGTAAASGSGGFTRALHRYLALSGLEHRGLTASVRLPDESLAESLDGSFSTVHTLQARNGELLASLQRSAGTDLLAVHGAPSVWLHGLGAVFEVINPFGQLVCTFAEPEALATEVVAAASAQGFSGEQLRYQSLRADYGLQSIYVFHRVVACNICGATAFGHGPGGRTSVDGGLPRCTRCQSLERHRALRHFWSALPASYLAELKVLQFSEDFGADAKSFGALEVSVYGGDNSLDLQAIDRPTASYDLVICNHVLEHVADDVAAVGELLRVIGPDGWLLLSVPDPVGVKTMREWGWPDEDQHGHYRVYSLSGLLERIRRASGDVQILMLPTRDPITGQPDCAFACSYSTATLKQVAELYESRVPRGHDFKLELVGQAERPVRAASSDAGQPS